MSTTQRFAYPRTKGIAITALFATILAILSLVSIPIGPVPITLQVFAVFLIAAVIGPLYGTVSCLVYLLVGAVGIPVFAGATSGIPILLGPTGGYLFAFPIAVFLGGMLCRTQGPSKKSDLIKVCLCEVVALIVIYVIGILWLGTYLHLSLSEAFYIGALPFIPIDSIKAAFAALIALRVRWSGLMLPTTVNSQGRPKRTGDLRADS